MSQIQQCYISPDRAGARGGGQRTRVPGRQPEEGLPSIGLNFKLVLFSIFEHFTLQKKIYISVENE